MAAISDRPCRFVGVDLHKQTITIAVVGGDRKLFSRRRFSNLQSDAIVAYLKAHAPLELVVEATASYEWFVQLVEPHARRVVLGHPGKLPCSVWPHTTNVPWDRLPVCRDIARQRR